MYVRAQGGNMSNTKLHRLPTVLVVVLAILLASVMSFSIIDGVSNAETSQTVVNESSIKIGHFSDIHYFPVDYCYHDVTNPNYVTSDFYNSMTGDTKLVLESGMILAQQVKQFIKDAQAGTAPHYVFATGDLSKNGEHTALIDVANSMRYMQNEVRKIRGYEDFQVFATPGNHDLYNASGALYSQNNGEGRPSDGVSAAQFALIFAGLGYPNANLTGANGALNLTDYLPEKYWSGSFTNGYVVSENAENLDIHYYNSQLEEVAHGNITDKNEMLNRYFAMGDDNNVLTLSVEVFADKTKATSTPYSFFVVDASDRETEEVGTYTRVGADEFEWLKANRPDTVYYLENNGHLEDDGYIDTNTPYTYSASAITSAFASGRQVYRATGKNHLCGGRLTEGVINWMQNYCNSQSGNKTTLGEETIVACFHQNALPHWEQEDEILKDFTLYNWEYTSKRLLDMGIRYVLTGHMHASDAMSYTDAQGRTLYDFQTGSCVSYDSPRRDLTISRKNCDGKLGETCESQIFRLDNVSDTPLKEVPSYNVFGAREFNEEAFLKNYDLYKQVKAKPESTQQDIKDAWNGVVESNPEYLAYMIQYDNGIGTLKYNEYINKEIYSQLLDRLVSHFLNQDTIDSLVGTVNGVVDGFANGTGFVTTFALGLIFPDIAKADKVSGTINLVQYILDTVVGGKDLGLTYKHNGVEYDTALGLVNAVVGEILDWSFGDENIGKMKVQDIAAFILTAHTAGVEISLDETYESIDAKYDSAVYAANEAYKGSLPTNALYRKRMLAAVKDMKAQLESGKFVENLLNALLNPIFVEEGSLLKSILGYHFDFEKAVDAGYLTQTQFNSLKKGLGSLGEILTDPDTAELINGFTQEKLGLTISVPADFSLNANDFCLLDIVNDLLPTIKGLVANLLGFSLDGPDVISIVNNFLDSYMVDSFYVGLGGIARDIVVAFATDVYPDLANPMDPTQVTLFQPYEGYAYGNTQLSYLSTINKVSEVGDTFNAATQDNGRVPSRVTGNFDTANSTTSYTVKFYTEENVYGTFRLLDKDGNVIGTVSTTQENAFADNAGDVHGDYLDTVATGTFDGITVKMLTQTKPQYVPLIDLGLLCITHGEIMDDDDNPYVYGDRDKSVANSVIYWNVHTVTITGLSAGTTYNYDIAGNYYVGNEAHYFSLVDFVKTQGYDKNTLTFTTAKDSSVDTFEFLTIADIQGMIQGMYSDSHEAVEALLNDERTKSFDFILNAGDMCDNGKNFNQWGMALNTYQDLNLNTSLFFTSGNHENNTGAMGRYFNYTALKDGEAQAITNEYYSFDYANAHFTVLDTNDATKDGLGKDQLAWLENDLKNTDAKWKFVLMHKSLYSAGSHATDAEVVAMRGQLVKLFAENGVNMVFAGHDHSYTTTMLVDKDGKAVDKTDNKGVRYTGDGVLYITLGTLGTKFYTYKENDTTTDKFNKDNSVLNTLDSQTFGKVRVEGDTLTFTGYYYNRDTKQIEEIGKTTVSNFNYRLMVILLSTLIPGTAVVGTGVGLGVHFGLKKKKAKISA